MAEYGQPGLYGEPQAPSLTEQMFGSPLKAQWSLQKGSMLMTFMNNNMWKQAMEGKGLKWSGVVGFRGIALGSGDALRGIKGGAGIGKAVSPARVVEGIMRGLGYADRADKFATSGLLGQYAGNDKFIKGLGRFFGGGIIESTKFQKFNKPESYIKLLANEGFDVRDIRELRKKYGASTFRSRKNLEKFAASDTVKGITGIMKADADAGLAASTILKGREAERALLKSNLSKRTWIKRAARLGRFATWAGTVSIAFDVGKAIGSFGTETVGAIADMAEMKLGNLVNKNMEFGGKVGIGFYASRSGTERQRALSAISGGRGGGPGFGNEAAYQHVDSTW